MQYRTDLAMERVTEGNSIPGVRVENAQLGDFSRNIVTIETDEAARQIQKAKGRYITFHTQPLKTLDAPAITEFAKLIAGSLRHLLPAAALPSLFAYISPFSSPSSVSLLAN